MWDLGGSERRGSRGLRACCAVAAVLVVAGAALTLGATGATGATDGGARRALSADPVCGLPFLPDCDSASATPSASPSSPSTGPTSAAPTSTQPPSTPPTSGAPTSTAQPTPASSVPPGPAVAPPFVHQTTVVLGKTALAHGVTTLAADLKHDGSATFAFQPVTVRLTSSLKQTTIRTVTTDGSGRASLKIETPVTMVLTVAYAGAPGYVPSSRSTTLRVPAPQHCSIRTRASGDVAVASGSCLVPHLPSKTRLRLQYLKGRTWVTAATGRSSRTTLHFGLALPAARTVRLRILLDANSIYGATTLSLPAQHVR